MLCVVGCDHQCRILDAVCCVLCAVCCVLCAVCEFTVRCKHLTLWDLQLSPADLTPMEAPQLVVYHHKLWKYATGVPPAAYCDEQQVYHLLLCCYSFCWPQKVYHLLLVRAKARKRKWSDFMLCVVGCDHQCRILDAVCCVLCANLRLGAST